MFWSVKFMGNRHNLDKYWVAFSAKKIVLQWKLMRGNIIKKRFMSFAFENSPRVSLICKLVPVQHREHEHARISCELRPGTEAKTWASWLWPSIIWRYQSALKPETLSKVCVFLVSRTGLKQSCLFSFQISSTFQSVLHSLRVPPLHKVYKLCFTEVTEEGEL